MRCTRILVSGAMLLGCGGGQRAVRDSLVRAGDERLAEGKREQALANYDRAIRREPDAAAPIIEKRMQVARSIAEDERAKARAALGEQRFEDAFKLLWNLDKGGAYGAGVDRAFFAEDYEQVAKAWWEQIDREIAGGRHFVSLRSAVRIAAAFPDGHWTHARLSALREEILRTYRAHADAAAPGSFGKTFAGLVPQLIAGSEGDARDVGRELRIALMKLYSVRREARLDSVSACARPAKAIGNQLTNYRDDVGDASAGIYRVQVTVRLDSCTETSDTETRTGTESYTETVPVQVQRDTMVREEWGTLGGQVSSCVTDSRGNCTGRSETRAVAGQKTYWLRKKKVTVTEYQEVTRTRDVSYQVEYETLKARGKVDVSLATLGADGQWQSVPGQSHDVMASVRSPGAVTNEDYDKAAQEMLEDAKLPELYGLLRKRYIEDYLGVARGAQTEGNVYRAAMGYLVARYGGHTGDDANAYLDQHLGLDTAAYDLMIAGEPMFVPLPVVALDLPEGEYTDEEVAYEEALETRARRRVGSQLAGVDLGFRVRRSPLRELGTMGEVWLMNSVELAVRTETQGISLSVGSQKLGGDTGGFNLAYAGRARRENGAAITYGVSLGGELRDENNQHTSLSVLLGYQQPIGPATLHLQIDPNLIQIFGGTGNEGESMHLTPILGVVEVPLGPLFARAGGSYFIGGLEPVSFEAMLGARVILGEQ